ncbi:MAG: hypothetical protein HOP30_02165 [Cyclobacteriaceae bacterium]|nr:hypothetical protein [Cyclobacteriaceae bacterium]
MRLILVFCLVMICLPKSLVKGQTVSVQQRTITSVKIKTFLPATVIMKVDESVRKGFVSFATNFVGFYHHALFLDSLPSGLAGDDLVGVDRCLLLNSSNFKQIRTDSIVLINQRLTGCGANCLFINRLLFENKYFLVTAPVNVSIEDIRISAKAKLNYGVLLEFKVGKHTGKGYHILNYFPKVFPNKAQSKLKRLFKEYPEMVKMVDEKRFSNDFDGLLEMLTYFETSYMK